MGCTYDILNDVFKFDTKTELLVDTQVARIEGRRALALDDMSYVYISGAGAWDKYKPENNLIYSPEDLRIRVELNAADIFNAMQTGGRSIDFTRITGVSDIYTCNCSGYPSKRFNMTFTGTVATVIFSNLPAGRSEILLEMTTTSATTMSWTLNGGTLSWAGGTPISSLAAGKTYRFLFVTTDGGATWGAYPSAGV